MVVRPPPPLCPRGTSCLVTCEPRTGVGSVYTAEMARTESTSDLPLGAVCPAFELPDVTTGRATGRDDVFGGLDDAQERRGLLVAFVCVHCPFVQHMEEAFGRLAAEFAGEIATVAISSNDVATHPEDAPEHMRAQAERLGWRFPYLYDESQETAREFHAACTPDLYLFDREMKLVYHAQFDGTRPYRKSDVEFRPEIHQAANGNDLRAAIEALRSGQPPLDHQRPSLGCNIKWR